MNHVGWFGNGAHPLPAVRAEGASADRGGRTPDPQWALTLAIRTALELHGTFDAEVDLRDTQSVVDLHWAGRQAGRLLGAEVRVEVGAARGPKGQTATVTVRCLPESGARRAAVEAGMRQLLRQVADVQSASSAADAPEAMVPHSSRAR